MPEREYVPLLAPVGDKIVRMLATDPARTSQIYKAFIIPIDRRPPAPANVLLHKRIPLCSE
ncbi:hypothetical protein [Massilia antarctica]|uniref:hypothetical protein n=1 Tax=Massilia antarctica TaxID=2765360 RepID=UPI00226FF248|nr:hypothetical protein [Massilia sp. H27-R4]MCY0915509.1 hypothetical protein [Massilia sp. H27-R4]